MDGVGEEAHGAGSAASRCDAPLVVANSEIKIELFVMIDVELAVHVMIR